MAQSMTATLAVPVFRACTVHTRFPRTSAHSTPETDTCAVPQNPSQNGLVVDWTVRKKIPTAAAQPRVRIAAVNLEDIMTLLHWSGATFLIEGVGGT